MKQHKLQPFPVCFVGDDEQSGPSWAAGDDDDDDLENRYGSKRTDVKCIKHHRYKGKNAKSNPELFAKPVNPHVTRTQLQSIQTRPKRSCRAPTIKYTF